MGLDWEVLTQTGQIVPGTGGTLPPQPNPNTLTNLSASPRSVPRKAETAACRSEAGMRGWKERRGIVEIKKIDGLLSEA